MIVLYACQNILQYASENKIADFENFKSIISDKKIKRNKWLNIGGQLIQQDAIEKFKTHVKSNKIKSWEGVHLFYEEQGRNYQKDKFIHAIKSLIELLKINAASFNPKELKNILLQSIATREWMNEGIYKSRSKDYTNPFRKMMYDNETEMNNVIGNLDDNSFILEQNELLATYKKNCKKLIKKWNL
jgi:hypothetical protein